MLATMTTQNYAQELVKKTKGSLELDMILMAMLFNVQIQVYYVKDSQLMQKTFDFPDKSNKERKVVKLYAQPNMSFDTVYRKSFIRDVGICQSILLDVLLLITLAHRIIKRK
jgi:hypothetical protein